MRRRVGRESAAGAVREACACGHARCGAAPCRHFSRVGEPQVVSRAQEEREGPLLRAHGAQQQPLLVGEARLLVVHAVPLEQVDAPLGVLSDLGGVEGRGRRVARVQSDIRREPRAGAPARHAGRTVGLCPRDLVDGCRGAQDGRARRDHRRRHAAYVPDTKLEPEPMRPPRERRPPKPAAGSARGPHGGVGEAAPVVVEEGRIGPVARAAVDHDRVKPAGEQTLRYHLLGRRAEDRLVPTGADAVAAVGLHAVRVPTARRGRRQDEHAG